MTDIKFTADELQGYKVDIKQVLQAQIGVLSNIEKDILADEEPVAENENRVLTPKKSSNFRNILNGEITKVENFDVVLAVVGTMKAGKSTTINAIVGREILPNRNRPMTALPTLICHNSNQSDPKLSFNSTAINDYLSKVHSHLMTYQNFSSDVPEIQSLIEFIKDNQTFANVYRGADNIFTFLQRLNDLVRLSTEINDDLASDDLESLAFPYNSYRDITSLPMIEVAFTTLNDIEFNTQGRFMLLDTPGPNEAGQSELKPMLAEQLERSSAVLMVLDYTQLNSEAEEGVKEQISAIPTIQKERLFAVVNKFDQKNANADDEQATISHVYNNNRPLSKPV